MWKHLQTDAPNRVSSLKKLVNERVVVGFRSAKKKAGTPREASLGFPRWAAHRRPLADSPAGDFYARVRTQKSRAGSCPEESRA